MKKIPKKKIISITYFILMIITICFFNVRIIMNIIKIYF